MPFSTVIGQDKIKARLLEMRASGRVPHALLFAGPAGTGKLPMAVAFARSLMCETPHDDGTPCGQCLGCRMAAELQHPDLHFSYPVIKRKGQSGEPTCAQYAQQWQQTLAKSTYLDPLDWLAAIKVENQQGIITAAEANEVVRVLSIKSLRGGYKVLVVWQADTMNSSAANKLLKILEEPPANTVFILVSSRPDALLSTILSRTQRIDFPPLPPEVLSEALVKNRGLSEEDAAVIAHTADGSYLGALSQLQADADAALFFDMFVLLMRLSYARRIKEMYQWADQVAGWGRERQKNFLLYCQRLLRENFIYNFQRPELNFLRREEADFAVRFARFINERNVIGIMDELSLCLRDISQNVNAKMVFTDFALKMIVLLIQ